MSYHVRLILTNDKMKKSQNTDMKYLLPCDYIGNNFQINPIPVHSKIVAMYENFLETIFRNNINLKQSRENVKYFFLHFHSPMCTYILLDFKTVTLIIF